MAANVSGNSAGSLAQAAAYIESVANKDKPITESRIKKLNESINTLLTSNDFLTKLNETDRSKIKESLSKLVDRISTDPNRESQLCVRFENGAVNVIKAIDMTSLPHELTSHQAYHGDPIRKGLDQLRQYISEDKEKMPVLQGFVRNYCDHVFSSQNSSGNMYLLRPNASYPNVKHKGINFYFFTITTRKSGVPTSNHSIMAYMKDDKGRDGWCTIESMKDGKPETASRPFNTLDQAIKYAAPNCKPVSRLSEKEEHGYMVGYAAVLMESGIDINAEKVSERDAERVFENDPIISALRDDSFSGSRLNDPVTAPGGHTYSRDAITNWLQNHKTDPLTREPLTRAMLRPNFLVAQLVATRTNQLAGKEIDSAKSLAEWKKDPILKHFTDPLTHDMMKEPVLAPNGISYDKEIILKYLSQHGNKLPSGEPCTPEQLIPNRVAAEVLAIRLKEQKFAQK